LVASSFVPDVDATQPGLRTLVLGGARSGKSAYAEALVGADSCTRYVATARLDRTDADFVARIEAHRARRPPTWTSVHDTDLVQVLAEPAGSTLVDDIGAWLTAELDDADAWTLPRGTVTSRTDALVAAVARYPDRLVIVSPEVGQGVIPETVSGRLFRDEIGTLNQRLAHACDKVVLVVAGLPVQLK